MRRASVFLSWFIVVTQTKGVTLDHLGSGVTEEQVFPWEMRGRAQPLEAGA